MMIKRSILTILAILFFINFIKAQPQSVKIVKILDTNLFLLDDGRKITLANLQMPSLKDTSQFLQIIVKDLLKYEKSTLLNSRFRIEPSPAVSKDSSVLAVHLFKTYLLSSLNFNKQFLEYGFAKYEPIDSLYRNAYLKAQNIAQMFKRGIWGPEQYLTQKKLHFFVGINGYLGRNHDSEEDELNEINILDFQLSLRNPINSNLILIKFGQMRIREKGFGACEVGPARHYAVDAIYRYLSLNSEINLTYVGFGFGFFFLEQMKKGFCQETFTNFVVPTANFRLGYLNKIYLSAALLNDAYSFWEVGINYRFAKPFSKIWIGYSSNFDRNPYSTYKKPMDFIGIQFQYYFKNRILFHLRGQVIPFTSNKLFQAGINLNLFRND